MHVTVQNCLWQRVPDGWCCNSYNAVQAAVFNNNNNNVTLLSTCDAPTSETVDLPASKPLHSKLLPVQQQKQQQAFNGCCYHKPTVHTGKRTLIHTGQPAGI